jgi:hypothetical protein
VLQTAWKKHILSANFKAVCDIDFNPVLRSKEFSSNSTRTLAIKAIASHPAKQRMIRPQLKVAQVLREQVLNGHLFDDDDEYEYVGDKPVSDDGNEVAEEVDEVDGQAADEVESTRGEAHKDVDEDIPQRHNTKKRRKVVRQNQDHQADEPESTTGQDQAAETQAPQASQEMVYADQA